MSQVNCSEREMTEEVMRCGYCGEERKTCAVIIFDASLSREGGFTGKAILLFFSHFPAPADIRNIAVLLLHLLRKFGMLR